MHTPIGTHYIFLKTTSFMNAAGSFLAVGSLSSAGPWLLGLCCPLCVRHFTFPCDISWIWGRARCVRRRTNFRTSSSCARSQTPSHSTQPPRAHIFCIFYVFNMLKGDWGCQPSLGRCSAVARHPVAIVCAQFAVFRPDASRQRCRNRTQFKLLMCVCGSVQSALALLLLAL